MKREKWQAVNYKKSNVVTRYVRKYTDDSTVRIYEVCKKGLTIKEWDAGKTDLIPSEILEKANALKGKYFGQAEWPL